MATQGSSTGLAFSSEYIKSKPGILRIIEVCIGICGIISESQGNYCGNYGIYSFYNFVVVTTLIIGVIILVIYAIQLDKLCTIISVPLSALINDAIFTIFYLIAAILMFVAVPGCRPGQAARIVAALFAVFGTIVVGLLAVDGYRWFRARDSTAGTSASV